MEKKNDDGLNEIMERMQNIDKADFDERKEERWFRFRDELKWMK